MSSAKGHSDITDFFIEDASEHLHNVSDDLLTLENNQDELDLVDRIFRSIHAIKGSAGMAGFHVTSQLAHSIEDLLGQIRSRELPVSGELVDLLFQGVDALTHEVEYISSDEEEDESLLAIFTNLRADFLGQPSSETTSQVSQVDANISPLELADRLIRQEQVEKAVAVYRELLRKDPSNRIVRQRLAETKALQAYIQKIMSY